MIVTKDKTLEMITEEIFAALVKQGGQCLANGSCAYGNSLGQHCAVGFLLPPGSRAMAAVDTSVRGLVDEYEYSEELGPNSEFMRGNLNFLEDLQKLHDETAPQDALTQFVTNYKFTTPSLNQWVAHRMAQLKEH